jgi:hypothetical protein
MLGSFDVPFGEADEWERVRQYHLVCEAYDRMVCSGWFEGQAMPVNGWERAVINAHATLLRRSMGLNFSDPTTCQANSAYLRSSQLGRDLAELYVPDRLRRLMRS